MNIIDKNMYTAKVQLYTEDAMCYLASSTPWQAVGELQTAFPSLDNIKLYALKLVVYQEISYSVM